MASESLLVEQKDVRVLSSMNRPHGTPRRRCDAAPLYLFIYTPRAIVVVSRDYFWSVDDADAARHMHSGLSGVAFDTVLMRVSY
jgi:hypothetical protein